MTKRIVDDDAIYEGQCMHYCPEYLPPPPPPAPPPSPKFVPQSSKSIWGDTTDPAVYKDAMSLAQVPSPNPSTKVFHLL